jgi:hypothetical protein
MNTRPPLRRYHVLGVKTLALAVVVLGCRSDTVVSPTKTQPPVQPWSSIARISVSAATVDLMVNGRGASEIVFAFDSLGGSLPTPSVTWSSDNPGIAVIEIAQTEGASGVIFGRYPGATTVHARVGQYTADVAVTVEPNLSLAILPDGEFGDAIQLAAGQTLQLTEIEYDRSTTYQWHRARNAPTWVSSRPDVATVSTSGVVTALVAGDSRITVSLDSLTASRAIHVAPTSGSATVRLVDADQDGALQFRSNNGDPVISLNYGDVHTQSIAAGTLFVSVDGFGLKSPPDCDCYDGNQPLQQFLGLLPWDSKLTLVATNNPLGFTLAPLWDWRGSIAGDSAMVRVLLSQNYGYNVYFAGVGAPLDGFYLRGCYLDWPYGVSDFSTVAAHPFDIILQPDKYGANAPEATRFTVTPQAGAATTYVITGSGPGSMKVLTLVDHP